MTTKIIRMQSGEDILADVHHSPNHVKIDNPMRLVFRRLPTGQTMMLLAPWLPNELVEEDFATISNSDILTIFNPKVKLVEYYNKMVEVQIKRKQEFGKVIDEYLQDEMDDADNHEEPDELTAEILEALNDVTRDKLH
jgi:hypothetical protein